MFDRQSTPTTASYASSAVTVLFGMNVNELVALGGLLLAFLTFLLNWWYKHQHLQLAATKSRKDVADVAEG